MAKTILLVSTSAGSMGGRSTGLWLAELAEPYYKFKAAGFDVTIASPAGGACPIDPGSLKGDFFTADAKKFMHDGEAVGAFLHSVKLDVSHVGQFDCVYVAGGHGCCVDMAGAAHVALKAIIEAQYTAGKVVASDCHGPYCLIECKKADGTPLVAGLEVTGFTNAEEVAAGAYEWVTSNAKLIETTFEEQGAKFNAGADWESNVVVAGNLITAQNPGSAPACADAVIKALA